jgi:DNA-binding CsgD family transcriptional regulator
MRRPGPVESEPPDHLGHMGVAVAHDDAETLRSLRSRAVGAGNDAARELAECDGGGTDASPDRRDGFWRRDAASLVHPGRAERRHPAGGQHNRNGEARRRPLKGLSVTPAPARHAATTITGRPSELEAVHRLLDAVHDGPAALVLQGDAGIGKTTIWRAAVVEAADRGFRVLQARPSESEARLSFGALADLLAHIDLDDHRETLPRVQRRALDVALLRETADEPVDPRTIASAVLNVLRSLASVSPVLIAIDDEQWLDAATAEAVGFAVRRLSEERVGLVVTSRTGGAVSDSMELARAMPGLVQVQVPAMDEQDLKDIVHARFDMDLTIAAAYRLHEVSRGNPFFALELGRLLQASGTDIAPGRALPVPDDLRALLRARLGELSASCGEVLLLASALDRPTVDVLEAASGHNGRSSNDLDAAVGADIIERTGEDIRFTHPLFASTVYGEATLRQRRDVHRRLASVLSDPEERARHVALSANAPSQHAANALEVAAAHALDRGARAAAAELSGLAVVLTPPQRMADVRRRGLVAAEHRFRAGDLRSAARSLESILATCDPGPERAAVLIQSGKMEFFGDLDASIRYLQEALEQPHIDERMRLDALVWLANNLINIGDLSAARPHVEEAATLAERSDDPEAKSLALQKQAQLASYLGYGVQRELLARAEDLAGRPVRLLALDLTAADELDEARGRLTAHLQDATMRGDEADVSLDRTWLALLELRAGQWDLALEHVAASRAVESGGTPAPAWAEEFVRVSRGEVTADGVGDASLRRPLGVSDTGIADHLEGLQVCAMAELIAGNAMAARRYAEEGWELLRGTGLNDSGSAMFVPEGVEALIQLGDLAAAEPWVAWLEERGRTLDRPRALATGARCRGLVQAAARDVESALASLEKALEHHERLPDPFERARTLLALGMVRRRAKQKRPARDALGAAITTFESLRAAPWIERARAELGAVSGRRTSTGQLTPTEKRVARLAAAGRTNREISADLFLSVRTVEGHLTHAYQKLGARSRTELAIVLVADDDPH